ncbi:hypothetical protein BN1723_012532 [Verticillium longisporum]|uniref:Protein PNS1 n=1 Tax=Verticillium longisporum TaxID=100787 RepID=A0A0G4LJ33_VERLO|nr:hypothetical protein BN1723_012532 [Verticillium longisporum]
MKYFATILSSAALAAAHGFVDTAVIGGKDVEFYQPYTDPYTSPVPERISRVIAGNGPILDVTSPDMQCGGSGSGSKPAALHAPAAAGSTRSMTHSFGSICFGSLIVAIINFLRHICSVARQQAGADGDLIAYILFCILSCLIALLDWAVSFLNQYAFAHIALYGKAYIPAAKDTWKMIKDRGIDALVNECLIGPVLSFGATFIGYACALLAFLYLQFTDPAYNSDGGYTPVIVAFSFLIGLQIANIFTTPISSGINAIFVASAWDPEVMMRDHPQLYQDMVRVYPKVQEAIHA